MTQRDNGILDLFSGPGGFYLGFTMAEFDIVESIDINENAVKTLEYNSKKITENTGLNTNHSVENLDLWKTRISDIKKHFKMKNYEITGIIGGPPCRGFSLANQQTRFIHNPLNKLVLRYVEIIKDIKPRFFVLENVPQILTAGKGKFVGELNADLNNIYHITSIVQNSLNFGVPQDRKRAIIIGIHSDLVDTIDSLKTKISKVRSDPHLTLKDAIYDLPKIDSGATAEKLEYDETRKISKYAKSLRYTTFPKIESDYVYNHITSKNGKDVLKRFKYLKPGQNIKDLPPLLLKNYSSTRSSHSSIYRKLKYDECSVTISNIRKNMFNHPKQNRGISVREAARIQSFPDWYEFKGGISSQQQQVADAIPPLFSKAIASAIKSELF